MFGEKIGRQEGDFPENRKKAPFFSTVFEKMWKKRRFGTEPKSNRFLAKSFTNCS